MKRDKQCTFSFLSALSLQHRTRGVLIRRKVTTKNTQLSLSVFRGDPLYRELEHPDPTNQTMVGGVATHFRGARVWARDGLNDR